MKKIKWIIPTLALMLAIGGSGTIAASAEKNLVDGLPFDPADREKQVVYISTLGELLSYTFDFFDGNGTMYLQYKLYNEYTLVLTKDMDLETDTSWHEYAPDWETYGWPSRAICANIEGAGHTISNLWGRTDPNSDGPRTEIGLFNILHYNFVRNLNIEYDSSKMATAPEETFIDRLAFSGDYGGLSTHSDHSHISNVHATGNFHMGGQVAGIVTFGIVKKRKNS